MRFLRRSGTDDPSGTSGDTATDDSTPEAVETAEGVEGHGKAYTPAKGRATPKRREAEAKRRGPVAPPPRTSREAMKRNKELRKANPASKEERGAAARERRERMMRGDDSALLPRDRGPVKAYARDLVDARRNVIGLFMPMAIVVFLSLVVPVPALQQYMTLVALLMFVVMAVEGTFLGRRITRRVRERFPHEDVKVGMYVFVRASQVRRLRVPRPRVSPGDSV